MAEPRQETQNGFEHVIKGKKLWVFRVTGGEAFRVKPDGNPAMVHDGRGESILRALLLEEEAWSMEAFMKEKGCRVHAHCPMETEEQSEERKNTLAVIGGERVFPCVRCPECAWFDPHTESLCGAGLGYGPGWEPEVVMGAMTSERFKTDRALCPLAKENQP